MNVNVWIKTNLADKALAPLRKELVALIEENTTVLDVGCGTGDLLFNASASIRSGFGIDLDEHMIQFAQEKAQQQRLSNLTFQSINALELTSAYFDVATSTLCLHEMPMKDACAVLERMGAISKRILIADYTKPKSVLAKLSIELDECISGHYAKFRAYRKQGGMPEYAGKCGLTLLREIPSSMDGISIWELKGKAG